MNNPHTLILAVGSSGDVHPMIALAQALKARGHKVTFGVNEYFTRLPQAIHLDTIPIGTEKEFKDAMGNRDLWHPRRALLLILKQFIARAIDPLYQQIAALNPDLIVGTPLSLGARIAHDKLKIPYSTVLLAPAAMLTVDRPPHLPGLSERYPVWMLRSLYWLINRLTDRQIAPAVNDLRHRLGLDPVRNIIGQYWHSPEHILCLFPEEILAGPRPKDWPQVAHFTGFPLYDESDITPIDQAAEAFLTAGPPPIVFTPGSANSQARQFFTESALAARQLHARAILLTRHSEQIPALLPPGVVHFPFVPLGRLLPRCSALVCHAGIGTVAQGLAAGIPQLVMPMAHDQPDNAWRLEKLGVGLSLPPHKYRANAVAAKLTRLLNEPTFTQNARQLAPRIRATAATAMDAACDSLERLLRR